MSTRLFAAEPPLYTPPAPGHDLRGMLRRRIVATALAQLDRSRQEQARLRTPAEWRNYSRKLRRRLVASLASVPFKPSDGPVRGRLLSEARFAGFSIENVVFESLPGCWVNATLWKPDPRRWAPPWRAIVTPVGHNGKYFPSEQHPPQVFAANGFLVVSFDPPGFGENAAGNNHFEDGVRLYPGGHNPLAFFVADARRVVDYVCGREDVDATGGVAMTGVSGGGFTSIACAAVDARVRIIGPSCFGLPDGDHPIRNGYAACPETLWFGRFADGLGLQELFIATGFVPALLMAGRQDSVMTEPVMRKLFRGVKAAYHGAGCSDKTGTLFDDCGHAYTVAQAAAFVRWVRRWWGMPRGAVKIPEGRTLKLLEPTRLQCNPPASTGMAGFAAEAARTGPAAASKDALRALVGKPGTSLQVLAGETSGLWTHELTELSLRDGRDWELPATWLRRRSVRKPKAVLVYFDARGRWQSLHQWGWLNRAAEVFKANGVDLAVLSVDLPGWGDTKATPSSFDVVGWGGVDRWLAYVSAATGDSVMAMRVREACRVLRWVRHTHGVRLRRIFVGGHGLGANVATYAAWLEGRVAGLVLNEPLLSFAELATAAKPQWPHDAYFPGILNAADFPAALRAAGASAIVVGSRDAAGAVVHRGGWVLPSNCRLVQDALGPSTEVRLIRWLHAKISCFSKNDSS
ncbi:MAG TPA: hypothetical protein PLF88_05015 [Opitutaceae bacterium]|nr:hypothetical protein [Opitutaceae bacterium]HRJ46848.1 hypothetical protein [Opitutaceae bacterium]